MWDIVVAPGAFKQSLKAYEVVGAIAAGLQRSKLQCTLHYIPISDGGNSLLDVLLFDGGTRRALEVAGPLLRPVRAAY